MRDGYTGKHQKRGLLNKAFRQHFMIRHFQLLIAGIGSPSTPPTPSTDPPLQYQEPTLIVYKCWMAKSGGGQGGRNLGVMGEGSLQETGEERAGAEDGIPMGAGAGKNRK